MKTCKYCKRCKSGCDFCACCGKCQRCDNHRCVPSVNPGPTFIPAPYPVYPFPYTSPTYPDLWWQVGDVPEYRTTCGGGITTDAISFTTTLGGAPS